MNMHADPRDMHPGLVAVHLHGPLADTFGSPHYFDITTPIEAIAAMEANYPGFTKDFASHEVYCIFADGDWRDGEDAARLPVSRDLHFCPVIEGRAFLGAALVGALFPAIAGTTAATIIGGVLFAGLMIGISFLLTPKIEEAGEPAEKDENYAFSGPANITAQGAAVPLVYGRVHCGSVVVSAGLELNTEYVVKAQGSSQVQTAGSWTHDVRDLRVVGDTPSTDVTPDDLPPPPGGWPAIIEGDFGWQPEGWEFAARQRVDQDGTSREINVWILDPETLGTTDLVYSWTEVRGFYAYEAATAQEDDEWREADTIEPPPPDIDASEIEDFQTLITSPEDGAVVDPLVPITGTTVPNVEVHLITNGGDHAQTMSLGDGSFEFAGDQSLGEPGEVVTIQATADQTEDSDVITVIIAGGVVEPGDTVISTPVNGETVDAYAPIIGTSDAYAEVHLLTNGVDHAQVLADGDGNFIFSGGASLGEPGAVVTIQATAENTNPSEIITVTIAESFETQTVISSPADGATVDASAPVIGTTTADTNVHLFINEVDFVQTMSDATGAYIFEGTPLGEPGTTATLQTKAEHTQDSDIVTVTIAEAAP